MQHCNANSTCFGLLIKLGMKRFILILLFVFTSALTFADHLAGGSISYTNIGDRKWQITLKIIANCPTAFAFCRPEACPVMVMVKPSLQLNPPGSETTVSPSSITINLTKVNIEDINQVEVNQLGVIAKNNCTNMGQQTAGFQNPSWEVYTFEGVLDMSMPSLNNSACKYWDITYSDAARLYPSITSFDANAASFALKTTLNIYHQSSVANGLKSNSPQLKNHPLFRAYAGNQIFYNPAAIDKDGDSLSYFVGQAYSQQNLPMTYAAPFSNTYPFPLNQTAEPHISYPQGINPYLIMDGATGTLSFNPVNNSANSLIGSVVIGIKQWSKDSLGAPLLVGIQEYEFPVMVVNNQGNNGIILKNTEAVNNSFKTAYTMLPTDTLVVNITAKDPDISSTSTRTDTTKIIQVFMSDSVNTTITHINGTSAEDAIAIKYTPGMAKLNTTQTFTVLAVDNNFPMQMSSRQFKVRVVDGVASANIAKTTDNCGQVTISYYNPVNVNNVVWNVSTIPNQYNLLPNQVLTYTSSAPIKLPAFNATGKYLVRLTIFRKEPENASPVFVYDTITVTKQTYQNPVKDTAVCANSPVAFTILPGNYLWTARHKEQQFDTTGNIFNDTVYANTVYYVSGTVTDSAYAGCVLFDTATVWVQTTPETHLNTTYALCNNAQVILKATAHNTNTVAYVWSNNLTDSVITVNQTGTYWVTLTNVQNGCTLTKTVQVIGGSLVNLTVPKNVTACQNDSVKLYANGAENYVWEELINGNRVVVSNDLAYLFKANQSKQIYVLGTSNNTMYCPNHDTVFVEVTPKPNLTISGLATIKSNDTTTFTIPPNPQYQITWSTPRGSILYSNDTMAKITWDIHGFDTLSVAAYQTNCGTLKQNKQVTVLHVDGFNTMQLKSKIKIYPNPANGYVNIDFDDVNEPIELNVFNNTMQQVLPTYVLDNKQSNYQLPVKTLTNGLYFIKLSGKQQSLFYKIVIAN